MHPRIRHLYAIAAGLFIAGLTWSTVDVRLLGAMITGIFGGRDEGLLNNHAHLAAGVIYARVAIVGFAVAAATAVTLTLWERRTSRWTAPLFVLLIAVLLAISLANFIAGNDHISRVEQAIVDLCLVIVALICIWMTVSVNVSGTAATVVKFTVIGVLLLEGVFTPAVYGLLWILTARGMMSDSGSRVLNPIWITSAGAIASMAASYWTLRRTMPQRAS